MDAFHMPNSAPTIYTSQQIVAWAMSNMLTCVVSDNLPSAVGKN